MILYHGSYLEIQHPDISYSRDAVDFGPGFYTTPIFSQAKNWSKKFLKQNKPAMVSEYTFDETALEVCKTLRFDSYSEEWLDFILRCRKKQDVSDYDIVTGGVANDKVFNTVELFYDNLIDREEAIKRLRYEKPNMQVVFRTQPVINQYLHFERSYRQ